MTRSRTKNQVKVIQDKDAPIAAEIIAGSIVEIAEGMRRLDQSRLTRAAVVALIHEHSKVSKTSINIVLNNLTNLEQNWLKKRVS